MESLVKNAPVSGDKSFFMQTGGQRPRFLLYYRHNMPTAAR